MIWRRVQESCCVTTALDSVLTTPLFIKILQHSLGEYLTSGRSIDTCRYWLFETRFSDLMFLCIFIVPQNGESEEMLGKHPLSGLDGAGAMLSILRKQFHCLLQTTADIMPKVIYSTS